MRLIIEVDEPPGDFQAAADPVVRKWGEDLARAINGPWPEKTGRSRFVLNKIAQGTYSVESPARYAQFVKLRGESAPFVAAHLPAIVARSEAELTNALVPLMGRHAKPLEASDG